MKRDKQIPIRSLDTGEALAYVDEVVSNLLSSCSEAEFESMHCPVCYEPLAFSCSPSFRFFSVSCTRSLNHVHTLRRNDKTTPNWWQKYVNSKFKES